MATSIYPTLCSPSERSGINVHYSLPRGSGQYVSQHRVAIPGPSGLAAITTTPVTVTKATFTTHCDDRHEIGAIFRLPAAVGALINATAALRGGSGLSFVDVRGKRLPVSTKEQVEGWHRYWVPKRLKYKEAAELDGGTFHNPPLFKRKEKKDAIAIKDPVQLEGCGELQALWVGTDILQEAKRLDKVDKDMQCLTEHGVVSIKELIASDPDPSAQWYYLPFSIRTSHTNKKFREDAPSYRKMMMGEADDGPAAKGDESTIESTVGHLRLGFAFTLSTCAGHDGTPSSVSVTEDLPLPVLFRSDAGEALTREYSSKAETLADEAWAASRRALSSVITAPQGPPRSAGPSTTSAGKGSTRADALAAPVAAKAEHSTSAIKLAPAKHTSARAGAVPVKPPASPALPRPSLTSSTSSITVAIETAAATTRDAEASARQSMRHGKPPGATAATEKPPVAGHKRKRCGAPVVLTTTPPAEQPRKPAKDLLDNALRTSSLIEDLDDSSSDNGDDDASPSSAMSRPFPLSSVDGDSHDRDLTGEDFDEMLNPLWRHHRSSSVISPADVDTSTTVIVTVTAAATAVAAVATESHRLDTIQPAAGPTTESTSADAMALVEAYYGSA